MTFKIISEWLRRVSKSVGALCSNTLLAAKGGYTIRLVDMKNPFPHEKKPCGKQLTNTRSNAWAPDGFICTVL